MKVSATGEGLLERIAIAANLVPRPLVETQIAFNAARAIMAGATLGIFDALADGPLTEAEVAARCGTDVAATRQLLNCLVGLEYLRWRDGQYDNAPVAQKWCVRSSPVSVHDKLVFQQVEWMWMARLEEYVRSGRSIDLHQSGMTPAQWAQYQDAMRALSIAVAPAVAKKLPMPANPTAMLDIGGSHGKYSIELCRRHPTLRSTILELPDAVEEAARLVEPESRALGGRVAHRAGDALADDLGEAAYDLVLMSNVAHHFSATDNERLAARVARALKPGGYYAVGEFDRQARPGAGGAIGATSDLYFSLTSTSGTWSVDEIEGWQRAAGLTPSKRLRYAVLPGYVSVVAQKR